MPTWSARIKELRKAGYTLGQIGEKIGLAATSVSDIEQERSESPRGDAALLLHQFHEDVCGVPAKSSRRSELRP